MKRFLILILIFISWTSDEVVAYNASDIISYHIEINDKLQNNMFPEIVGKDYIMTSFTIDTVDDRISLFDDNINFGDFIGNNNVSIFKNIGGKFDIQHNDTGPASNIHMTVFGYWVNEGEDLSNIDKFSFLIDYMIFRDLFLFLFLGFGVGLSIFFKFKYFNSVN